MSNKIKIGQCYKHADTNNLHVKIEEKRAFDCWGCRVVCHPGDSSTGWEMGYLYIQDTEAILCDWDIYCPTVEKIRNENE